MTVANGREFLSIPGPTNVPDAVLAAMQRPAIDIYSGEMVGITDSCLADLKTLFRTAGPHLHLRRQRPRRLGGGAHQRALARRDRAGAGERPLRARLGRDGQDDGRRGRGAEGRLAPRRRSGGASRSASSATRATRIKAVLVVQIDTASGVVNDIPAIRKAIDAAKHPALLMVDCVASLGCMPFEMDGWGVDVAMAGSQKGLMTPPGLAFVAANERARAVHKAAGLRTLYWDWTFREGESPLPEVLRHAARAPAVRPAQGARHALRGRPATRRSAGTRCWPRRRGRAVAKWAEGQVLALQHRQPGRARRTRSPACSCRAATRAAARLLRATSAASCWASAWASSAARPSASPTWATSTRRWCSARWARWRWALTALGIPHGSGGVQAAIDWLGQSVPA